MNDQRTILLVDDDASSVNAVRETLESLGHRVVVAETEAEGMAAARRERPSLIVLEMVMNGSSAGLHLVYELKRDERLRTIPVLILSAASREIGIDFRAELGSDYMPAVSFLDKPVNRSVLAGEVRRWLA